MYVIFVLNKRTNVLLLVQGGFLSAHFNVEIVVADTKPYQAFSNMITQSGILIIRRYGSVIYF